MTTLNCNHNYFGSGSAKGSMYHWRSTKEYWLHKRKSASCYIDSFPLVQVKKIHFITDIISKNFVFFKVIWSEHGIIVYDI